ncbi:MAG: DUF916 and DUF3324 domain-containing protein [Oscillospiraceae bacterium]|jgi:hypothetical protein|nr:DUF916 and DUF3324 domain-containing protein [Oscillospiraceae bacterium]
MRTFSIKYFLAAVIAAVLLPRVCRAADYNMEDYKPDTNGAGFYVEAVPPATQFTAASYFDVLTAPGVPQTLEVEVRSERKQDMLVRVEIGDAYTNPNGLICYDAFGKATQDQGLRLSDMVDFETRIVSVPAGNSVRIPINILPPAEPFAGEVLGGLTFTPVVRMGTQAETEQSSGVRNVFAYSLAVLLRGSAQPVSPRIEGGQAYAAEDQGLHKLFYPVRNTAAATLRASRLNMQVFAHNQDAPVFEVQDMLVKMAPQSQTDLQFYLPGNLPLTPGDYRVWTTVDNGEECWRFESPLTVGQ